MHYTNRHLRWVHRVRWTRVALWAAVVIVGVPVAHAQISPGSMGGGPGMGGPAPGGGSGSDDKKEGVAEAAPKTPGLLPTTPALPAPKGRRKRWKLFELDGYYRMRTDWTKNFNLGFPANGFGGTPFPTALSCQASTTAFPSHPCDSSIGGANMRLRLEPTLNLDEGTSVHVQADALDNIVLGSTPNGLSLATPATGLAPPLAAFTTGQGSVLQGVNSDQPSIVVKRAWGEVALPFGVLKFGRMPNQWGMGMLYNAGGADPINGTYDYDADYGDTVDRASFSLLIPGTNIRAMLAYDWTNTGLASNQTSQSTALVPSTQSTSQFTGNPGHPFDLDDSDDVISYVGVISRIDSPQEFKDTVDRGELALNYGVYFEYRTQDYDYDLTGVTLGTTPDPAGTATGIPRYTPRNLKMYSPDVWGKIGFGHFLIEAELAAQLGTFDISTISQNSTVPITTSYDVRKFGGVGRLTWKADEGKLRLGLETGFATGDQWDNTPQGATNIAFSNPLGGPGDTTLTQFMFNRDYRVDLLMWRYLIGAVTNAVYVKPFLQYDVTKGVTFKISNVTSFAIKPVATPGNSPVYGTEFDGDLGYNTGGLYVGVSYGLLFPLGAMNHPADDPIDTTQTYGYTNPTGNDVSNVKDAETAHIIQTRLILSF